LIILAALIVYCLLIEPLGYIISTFLFLFVGFETMKKGKYLSTLLIAAIVPIVVYYGYVEVMKGTLPGLPF
jgi:putative tricarboxylic transport membrane protein